MTCMCVFVVLIGKVNVLISAPKQAPDIKSALK